MKIILIVISALLFIISDLSAQNEWGKFRGMNAAPATLTEIDVRDFAKTGGNLLRLSMPAMPLMVPIHPDFEGKRELDSVAFKKLDQAIDWCETYGIKVIIDPHTFPGQNMVWTMLGYDKIWTDIKYHEYIITIWEAIAKRYVNRGAVIAGYDLLNEPIYHVDYTPNGANDLNNLYKKIIQAVRKIDKTHTIIVAAPYLWDSQKQKSIGYTIGIKYLDFIG